MAGGFGSKLNPKNKSFSLKKNNSEILKEFPDTSVPNKPKLSGTLFPGQSINFNKEEQTKTNFTREFLAKTVNQEHAIFVNQHTQEIKQSIDQLKDEIKKLVLSAQNLDQEIVQASEQNIPESNEYQLNFLQRIRNLVIQFRQNIDESCIWLQSFNRKKSRKNAFWGNVRNKKNGGEQYLFSGEHSVARSAN
ncbi:MAG: DUF5660 domain-containing protein [Candidatus Shapirobacteria bacterium]|nr:DUF5660 domain-containing protein [Candidatus Shapirobacteria bacterium]